MRSKGLALEQILDIVAFRIVVPTEQACYDVLHAVHERFEPLLLRFKDYIAHPKKNGYRSLHTCVKAPDGVIFEIQIRTPEMHDQAEGGSAAHWRYSARPSGPGAAEAQRRLRRAGAAARANS
jgi:GTP pyrophosphokinase